MLSHARFKNVMRTNIDLMLDRLRNVECPKCHAKLSDFNSRVLVKRANPTWNQLSHYYVYPCKHCSANLRISNRSTLVLILFVYFLVSGYLYFMIYDSSKLLAGIAMLVSVVPFLYVGSKYFKLEIDA